MGGKKACIEANAIVNPEDGKLFVSKEDIQKVIH